MEDVNFNGTTVRIYSEGGFTTDAAAWAITSSVPPTNTGMPPIGSVRGQLFTEGQAGRSAPDRGLPGQRLRDQRQPHRDHRGRIRRHRRSSFRYMMRARRRISTAACSSTTATFGAGRSAGGHAGPGSANPLRLRDRG
ncbi:MAG: hypothetical protein R2854_11510 [Caldilineaceae bacterium]